MARREMIWEDDKRAAVSCFSATTMREKLFADADPIGGTIRIRDVPFAVIGKGTLCRMQSLRPIGGITDVSEVRDMGGGDRTPYDDFKSAIPREIYLALRNVDAPSELLAILASWRETMDDAETLEYLRIFNRGELAAKAGIARTGGKDH